MGNLFHAQKLLQPESFIPGPASSASIKGCEPETCIIAIGIVILLGFILIWAAGAEKPVNPTPLEAWMLTFTLSACGIPPPGGISAKNGAKPW